MKDALAVSDLIEQAAQLQAALKAANDEAGAEAAAAAQHAQAYQQQLGALRADHAANVENAQVTLITCVPTSMIELLAKA